MPVMDPNSLRKSFIAMLFALVIATIAQRSTDILFQVTVGWSVLPFGSAGLSNLLMDDWKLLAAVTHASLALLLVSVSWVGWSKSVAAGNKEAINNLASWAFVLLLIEVVLVTLYFGLASSIELTVKDYQPLNDAPAPSSRPEAMLIGLVFLVYFIWDIIADVIKSPIKKTDGSLNGIPPWKLKFSFLTGILTYGFCSFVCMLLAFAVYTLSPLELNSKIAVFGDGALIGLVFLFRSMKSLERYFIKLFPWEGTRKNSMHEIPSTLKDFLFIAFPSLLFIVCIGFMMCLNG
jgi:hypothetical protein